MTSKYSSTVKVGFLSLVSILLLVFVLIWLRGRGIAMGEPYTVLFDDVDGMREGAPVQIMGIRVGFVDKVEAVEVHGKYYVRVIFSINDDNIKIPKGSLLAIEQSGLIGEKLLEITPPRIQEVTITTFDTPTNEIIAGLPVKFLYQEGYMDVGAIERVEQTRDENLVRHKLYFRVTLPGARMPDKPIYDLVMDSKQQYFLRILSEDNLLAHQPDNNLIFTIENPLRMKEFLQIQLESAEALRLTNDKVSQLLSDETITTLNNTLKNTEILTAQASSVLDNANQLFSTAHADLEQLVKNSDQLAVNLIEVSKNVNNIIGNPQLQDDLKLTVSSIQKSAEALDQLLTDPALKETLALTRDTSRNAAELTQVLRDVAHDKDLQARLDSSLTLMNESLAKLSSVLSSVETLTTDKDGSLKEIIDDTQETTENLRQFSKKLNGRFTLFRLMF